VVSLLAFLFLPISITFYDVAYTILKPIYINFKPNKTKSLMVVK